MSPTPSDIRDRVRLALERHDKERRLEDTDPVVIAATEIFLAAILLAVVAAGAVAIAEAVIR